MCELQLETGNDLDAIGFKSSRGPFQISFYGEMENNYKLIVEDFGMNQMGGGWEVMQPTDEQILLMQRALLAKRAEIENAPKEVVTFQENYGIYSDNY